MKSKQRKANVNEEEAINSISHKALSRQKGILCGLGSPNKTRLEENRKGKKEREQSSIEWKAQMVHLVTGTEEFMKAVHV